MKNIEWAKKEIKELMTEESQNYPHDEMVEKEIVLGILKQLDELEVLSQEWIDKHKVDYHNWIPAVPIDYLQNLLVPKQEEPTQEQVQKYLSEHGIEVVEKEPETVAVVVTTFWKSYERLKEVMSMEVEGMEG